MANWTKLKSVLNKDYDYKLIQRLYEAGFVIVERKEIADTCNQLDKLAIYHWAKDLCAKLKHSLIQPI